MAAAAAAAVIGPMVEKQVKGMVEAYIGAQNAPPAPSLPPIADLIRSGKLKTQKDIYDTLIIALSNFPEGFRQIYILWEWQFVMPCKGRPKPEEQAAFRQAARAFPNLTFMVDKGVFGKETMKEKIKQAIPFAAKIALIAGVGFLGYKGYQYYRNRR